MVREDQFLRPSAVDDVCHPIVEVRRSAPRDGDAAQPQAPPAFYFCERFPTAFHRRVDLRLRCAGRSDRRTAGRAPIIARQPYECRDFSVKASFVREKCPCATSTRLRRSEEHTSELQSRLHLVCRLLLEKKKNKQNTS